MSSWVDRQIAEARKHRADLTAGIEDVLAEISRVDAVLAALGAPVDDVPVVDRPLPSVQRQRDEEDERERLRQSDDAAREALRAREPEHEPEFEYEPSHDAPPPPEARPEPEPPAEIADRIIALLGEKGPLSAKKLREQLGVDAIGDVLFDLEQSARIHRHDRRERGTGQVQFVVGTDAPRPPATPSGDRPAPAPAATTQPPSTAGEKKKQPTHPGVDAMPEHLRGMPVASKNFPLKPRIVAAEFQLKVLQAFADGPKLANVAAAAIGDRNDRALSGRVGKALREDFEPAGLVRATGNIYHAPWQIEQKERTGQPAGRPSIEFALTNKGRAVLGLPEEEEGDEPGPSEPGAVAPGAAALPTDEGPLPSADDLRALGRTTITFDWKVAAARELGRFSVKDFAERLARTPEWARTTLPSLVEQGVVREVVAPSHNVAAIYEAVDTAAPDLQERPQDERVVPLETVRDFARLRGEGNPFAISDVMHALGEEGYQDTPLVVEAVEGHLGTLVNGGVVVDVSPTPDLRLFEYQRVSGPGKAAQLDIQRRPAESTGNGGGSVPVAGTGKLPLPPQREAADLVRDVRKAGYDCTPAGSGHWAVTGPGIRRMLISGSPSRGTSVHNDRKRLQKAGVPV